MRAAWSRRTDDELLRGYFLEELSPAGRAVVTELVTTKFGAIDALLDSYNAEQGVIEAVVRVRGCEIDPAVKDERLPLMWGHLVFAARGIGFVPGGHDDALDVDDASDRAGDLAAGVVGSIAGRLAGSILSGLMTTSRPVGDRGGAGLPLPLLARIEPNALWLPHARYDAVLWGPDFGEVVFQGERLLCVEPPADAEAAVQAWAAAHEIDLTALEPAPLLR